MVLRKIIAIDDELCDGCGQCVPACAEGAIRVENGKARVVSDRFCDGLGACIGDCPNGALSIEEREAEEFDEEAVETYLEGLTREDESPSEPSLDCGCPSTRIQTFADPPAETGVDRRGVSGSSTLSHWPVQIRLIPPSAPFLKDAELLVMADCVPVAYPRLHEDFLGGRVVMIGCPKFDDAEEYIERFTELFRSAGVRGVTVLTMEVPCCSALPTIVKKAMEAAGSQVPLKEIVISTRGEVLN